MGIYRFERQQWLHADLMEVWDFISSPSNLQRLTPEGMGFTITSKPLPEKMYAGMMIRYRVRPIAGIPFTWLSEITQLETYRFFVDEQRMGPYTIWHHEHHLEETPDGILMKDIITYKPPLGFIGDLMDILFIRKKLNNIFQYRRRVLHELFNAKPSALR